MDGKQLLKNKLLTIKNSMDNFITIIDIFYEEK